MVDQIESLKVVETSASLLPSVLKAVRTIFATGKYLVSSASYSTSETILNYVMTMQQCKPSGAHDHNTMVHELT